MPDLYKHRYNRRRIVRFASDPMHEFANVGDTTIQFVMVENNTRL